MSVISRAFLDCVYCGLNELWISNPVVVSTRDLRDALSPAESRPLRGRVVEDASKLLSLGFHTGDPTTIINFNQILLLLLSVKYQFIFIFSL